ncbi:MAG TPA: carbamate kinase [Bacteroidales bacterium]|nr:MAG: carbamate kinase [Bacteroidetes bacterium GWF2_33_38]HBF89258.1 carbamate kinase [Bacteroidales bacterium]
MNKLAVVALGGNALLRAGQKGTIDEQEENVLNTCRNLLELIKQGYNLVITHGNGPQVGNILLQNSAGAEKYGVPEMPLDICGAYSQGFIGYMIEQQLRNLLESQNINRDILTLVTQVLVNKSDPAFQNPTKPIGPYYSKEQVDEFLKINPETVYKEDKNRGGWRKVVASPKPNRIANRKSIETLARNGQIIIAVGGGGIPVFYKEPNVLQGIDAVIDKDLASSLLAQQIGADELYILTDVPKVCLNYGTPEQKNLDVVTVAEAKQYILDKQFGEGSMAPKVQAAREFIKAGGKVAIITASSELGKLNAGTRIVLNK